MRDITQTFLASPEAQKTINATDNDGFVEQLYLSVLGRPSDPNGKAGWVKFLDHGGARTDVADKLLFSSEHLGQLQSAYTTGIYVSDPTDASLARLYYGLLGRAPDLAGLTYWESLVQNNKASLTAITQEFLRSIKSDPATPTTDQQFVDSLYKNALGRTGGSIDEQSWLSDLSHGASRASVALDIINSPEARAHLTGFIEQGWHLL